MKKHFLQKEEIKNNINLYSKTKLNGVEWYCLNEYYERFRNKRSKKISNEEVWTAIYFQLKGIEYVEAPKLTLLSPFKTHYKKYGTMTYLPDGIALYKGRKLLIEVKGYIQQDKQFKYKMIDYMISNNFKEYEYYIVKWKGSEKLQNKELYLYCQSIQNKKVKKRTNNNFETLVLDK